MTGSDVLIDGQHVDSGIWEAHDGVRVFASGRAKISAFDRSRVMASGSALVWVYGDEARVVLCDGATARVMVGHGTVVMIGPRTETWANDHARVEAFAGEVRVGEWGRIIVHRRATVWAGLGVHKARILADHQSSLSPGSVSYNRFRSWAWLRWWAP